MSCGFRDMHTCTIVPFTHFRLCHLHGALSFFLLVASQVSFVLRFAVGAGFSADSLRSGGDTHIAYTVA